MQLERIGANRWLVFNDPRLLDWCAEHIDHIPSGEAWHREGAQALGVATRDDIVAVMVVHGWERRYRNCQISMAATDARWATRSTIQKLLNYPFGQLGVERVTTIISSENARALKFNEGLGFVREGCLRRGCGDHGDAVILGLLREDAQARGWLHG